MAATCLFLSGNRALCTATGSVFSNFSLEARNSNKRVSFVSFNRGYESICIKNPRNALKIRAQAEEASVSTEERSPETLKRLYVGNIPRDVNNAKLSKIFSEHGSVEKAEVMYDKYSGRSRLLAFVTMSTIEDANAAIEKLNGVVRACIPV
ncbi:hypothetical protein AMTR_s00052p00146070 [Amborella trichopoda]|uniref:RRM domain-containing protein n=1 Tax=Amborella trichopoda TaxID=13333 RepID=U5D4Q5_AMBTC|nr:hypothetical protein AMTR_s00052p00146070 [Amborella trichopoda]